MEPSPFSTDVYVGWMTDMRREGSSRIWLIDGISASCRMFQAGIVQAPQTRPCLFLNNVPETRRIEAVS
jgi:hypothetical protein